MLFDIEADEGNRIVAYVVPDSGSGTPSLRLSADGRELVTLAANDVRANLVEAGRHATGLCGFVIDEAQVPGLASYTDLELTDAANDILVYRRRPPRAVDARVFRLETHLVPLVDLDAVLRNRFQYWYAGIDRFGLETATQVFCLETPSIFVSGRLLLKNFDYYLARGVKCAAMLRDPFHELAERLLLLRQVGESAPQEASRQLGTREAMTFATAIESLRDCNLADPGDCRRFFKRAPEPILKALSNPLVRQLTTVSPDEMPGASGVASALDALAGFEVLGLRSDADSFNASLAEIASIDAALLPRNDEHPDVRVLGEILREIHTVEDILEKDLQVFYQITHAFDAVGERRC